MRQLEQHRCPDYRCKRPPFHGSIKPDYIACLEEFKKLNLLKRHMTAHY